jgi:small subunit ribosomal protein S16
LAVKIRLRRVGAKHQPSYRIVVADSRSPRDGRFIDQVGTYNPRTNPATVTLNRDKAIDWLRKGAQPTETVEILLKKASIVPSEVRKGEAPAGAGMYSQGPEQKAAYTPPPAPAPAVEAATAEAPQSVAAAVPDTAEEAPAEATASAAPEAEALASPEVVAEVIPVEPGEEVTIEVEPSEIPLEDAGE